MRNVLLVICFMFGGLMAVTPEYTSPVALITNAQNITSVWTDVGSPIKADGFKRIIFPVTFAINLSSNVRFRVVYQETSGSTDTNYLIPTSGASAIAVEDKYYEFNQDRNDTALLDFSIVPLGYVQLQTQVSAEGSTKASLTAAKYFLLNE